MKSVLDILVENLKIGTSGFSNEKQIYGILKCATEIDSIRAIELKEVLDVYEQWNDVGQNKYEATRFTCACWNAIKNLAKQEVLNEKT